MAYLHSRNEYWIIHGGKTPQFEQRAIAKNVAQNVLYTALQNIHNARER